MAEDLTGHVNKIFDPIHERTTHPVGFTLQDETAAPIPGSSLTEVTFKLYAVGAAAGSYINDRNGSENLKSLVNELGVFSLELTPADNAIVDATLAKERHRLAFRWKYGVGGAKEGMVVYELPVLNHANIP